jgi:hypothetical protein
MKLTIDTDKRTAECLCNMLRQSAEFFAENPDNWGAEDAGKVLPKLRKIVEELEWQMRKVEKAGV